MRFSLVVVLLAIVAGAFPASAQIVQNPWFDSELPPWMQQYNPNLSLTWSGQVGHVTLGSAFLVANTSNPDVWMNQMRQEVTLAAGKQYVMGLWVMAPSHWTDQWGSHAQNAVELTVELSDGATHQDTGVQVQITADDTWHYVTVTRGPNDWFTATGVTEAYRIEIAVGGLYIDEATITPVETPTLPATWGGIKSLYKTQGG